MGDTNIGGEVAEIAGQAGKGIVSEVANLGKAAFAQMLGKNPNDSQISDDELKLKSESDDKKSEVEHAEVAVRVRRIYEEYEAKKKKEGQQEEQQEQQEEEAKKMEEFEEKKEDAQKAQDIKVATGKASAETGKHYGAE